MHTAKNLLIAVSVLFMMAAVPTTAQIRSTPSGGAWNASSTWIGGVVPDSSDSVVISSGSEVGFQSPFACASLIVEPNGTLSSATGQRLSVLGAVLNQGSILGESGTVEAYGNVVNEGIWTMRLNIGGNGARTVTAPGVDGDLWITGAVVLENDNILSRLDAFDSQAGTLLVQEGATLKLTTAPAQGYTPAAIGFPDGEELVSRGTIIIPNKPGQISNIAIGSRFLASLGVATTDSLWVETHTDQLHPTFTGSVRQWFRTYWTGTSDPTRPNLTSASILFDQTQLNGLDTGDLFVYHSQNGGQTWTRVTTNAFEVIYDPNSGIGFVSVSNVPSQGDFVIADSNGPANSAPSAENDLAFTMQTRSVLIDVLRNDGDADGNTIRIVSATNGSSGTTTIENGQIRYTPSGSFIGGDSFTYAITDDVSGDGGATVTVRVADPATSLFVTTGDEIAGPNPEVFRRRLATINFEYLNTLSATENGSLALNLFDDETVILDRIGSKTWSTSESAWMGGSQRFGDWVTLEFDSENNTIFATAWSNTIPYQISRQPDGSYAIDELDLSGLIDEIEADVVIDTSRADRGFTVLDVREVEGPSSGALGKSGPDPSIDVLVLFTTSARDSSGSQLRMQQEIFNAINNTNQSYRNSGVNAVVRLAGVAMMQYDETGDYKKDLDNLVASGQKRNASVSTLREQFKADVVGLVVGSLDACGVAKLMTTVSNDHNENAFFIVEQGSCLGNNLSFAHEIGHIQGARHDRFVDNQNGSPFSYNHGYVNPIANWTSPADTTFGPNQWRTIMAYNDACTCTDEVTPCPDEKVTRGPSCSRLMWWSSPTNTWTGSLTMGIASGANAANNVRTLNATAATVAGFRGAQPAISGTITDISTGQGLQDVLLEGVSATQGYNTISDAAGFYALLAPSGASIVLTPVLDGYAFDPPAVTVNNLSSDVTRNFTATPLLTVAGKVTRNGFGLRNVEIRGADQVVLSEAGGVYSLELPWDWPGTLTPYFPGYDFAPATVSFDTLRTDSLTNDFVATVKRLTISGSVTSLTGGVSGVTLQGLPGPTVTDANGNYSLVVDYGWDGEATPTKPGYSFEPFSRTYISVSRDLDHDYDAYPGGLARSEWPMFSASPSHSARLDIPSFTNESRWSANLSGRITSPVIGQDGTIYVTATTKLYARDQGGAPLWDINLPNAAEASPAVGTAGRLYVPSGGVLIAYNVIDQSVAWSYFTGDRILSSPVIDVLGNIYVGSNSDSLFAISPNGVRLWAYGTGGDVRSSPALSETGNVYFGSDDGSVYALSSSGNLIWKHDTGGAVRSSPMLDGSGSILIGTDADALLSLNAASGNQQWRYAVGGAVRGTPALGTEGGIYFGSMDSTFYALTPNGSLDWSYDVTGPISASPAVGFTRVRRLVPGADEEVVYVAAQTSTVYAFNIRTPNGFSDRLRWQYFGATTSPVLTRAGLLTASEFNSVSTLYALKSVSRSLVQLSVLLNDFGPNFDPDKLAAILWLEAFGGPLALLPDFSGPCKSGPLIIPDCPLADAFGKFNELVLAQADRNLVLGLVEWSNFLADVISGNSTEGLLATFNLNLKSDVVSSVVLAGLLSPEEFAPNPEGLSTAISLFQNAFSRKEIADPELVYLMSGNFSTDASALDFSLTGDLTYSFRDLSFGGLSNLIALPEGQYDLALQETGPGKDGRRVLAAGTLDLRGKAGQIVGLYATGFVDPSANKGGPGIGLVAATGDGEVLIGNPVRNQESKAAEKLTFESVYPNPAILFTTIAYDVPTAQPVRIDLFDLLGRHIQSVVDEVHGAGSQNVTIDVAGLSSGVYLLRLVSGDAVVTRKLTIVR